VVDLLSDSEDGGNAAEVILDGTEESDAEESDAESLPAALQPPTAVEPPGRAAQAARPANTSRAGADIADAGNAAKPAVSEGAAADGAQPTQRTASVTARSPPSAVEARRASQVRHAP